MDVGELRRHLTLSLGATAAFMLVAEAFLALLGLPRPRGRMPAIVREEVDLAEEGFWDLPPWMEADPHLHWRHRRGAMEVENTPAGRGFVYRINSQGFRGPELTSPEGRPLVFCLGDSVTAGYAVGDADAYPAVLQGLLRGRWGRRDAVVVNAGVNGYSSEQGRAYLEEILHRWRPDVILLEFGPNDNRKAVVPDPPLDGSTPGLSVVRRALRRSRLYLSLRELLVGWKLRLAISHGDVAVRVLPERYRRNLGRMVEDARDAGARVILLSPTSKWDLGVRPQAAIRRPESVYLHAPMEVYRRIVASVARDTGSPWVELPLLSGRDPGSEERFVDWCHPDAEGLCVLAEATAAEVDRVLREPR